MAQRHDARKQALERARDNQKEMRIDTNENAGHQAQKVEMSTILDYLSAFDDISELQKTFLTHLIVSGLPSRACYDAGVPPRTYYGWIQQSSDFKSLVTECIKMSADRLEHVAVDLATGVYMEPLVSQGIIAGYKRIYDSKLLLALLKARKPQEFGQKLDITSNGQSIVKLVGKEEWDSI